MTLKGKKSKLHLGIKNCLRYWEDKTHWQQQFHCLCKYDIFQGLLIPLLLCRMLQNANREKESTVGLIWNETKQHQIKIK